jgi:hypothetical protein
MNLRHTLVCLSLAIIFASAIGCEKSKPETASLDSPTQLSPDTIVQVYWRGKNDLGNMAGAYYLMCIWELPQSAQLEVQTLRKLSTMPWRMLKGENYVTNQAAALLYPLLADMVWNESYFEIRQPPNQPAEFVLSIRLDPSHEQLWETNLAAVAESLAGSRPVPAPDGHFGWSLDRHAAPTHISLTRAGQWTLVSAGPDQNDLLADISARIQRDHTPYVPQTPDDWLEADLDLARLKALLPPEWNLPSAPPKVALAVNGDGAHVLTHAVLSFSRPLHVALQRWSIPTNLIHQPLLGFTAARGFQPWLQSWKPWNDLQMGQPPDQICLWALPGGPVRTYFAAPLPDAASQVRVLAAHLLDKANPWLAARGYLGFELNPASNGVIWGRSPAVRPFVQSDNAAGVAYGGLIPDANENLLTNLFYYRPSFSEMLQEISRQTNLVYYHWELSGDRLESCLYVGQLLSVIARQTPLPMDSLSAVWLKTIMPRLGNCTTTVALDGQNRLLFTRESTLGFTAAELVLLANWLESPQFPFGLYSSLPSQPSER